MKTSGMRSPTPSRCSTFDPDADPPKVLAIGPDTAANLLEVIWLELDDDRDLVIHAMALRTTFFSLIPNQEPRP